MTIVKSVPSERLYRGKLVKSSEITMVSESFYETTGEEAVIVRNVDYCKVRLNSTNTDHITIKALTKVLIVPDIGQIDEEFDEILIDRGACVELRFCMGLWYIMSSDGLKIS